MAPMQVCDGVIAPGYEDAALQVLRVTWIDSPHALFLLCHTTARRYFE